MLTLDRGHQGLPGRRVRRPVADRGRRRQLLGRRRRGRVAHRGERQRQDARSAGWCCGSRRRRGPHHVRRRGRGRRSRAGRCSATGGGCRACSRTRSARTTPSSRPTGCSHMVRDGFFPSVPAAEWRTKVEEALDGVRLDPGQVLGKYPHQLSGGQLQRMLIARALLLDIDLLVADEIISMLDASTRIDVLNLLADLKARGLGHPLRHPRPLAGQLPQRQRGDPQARRGRRDGADRGGLRQSPAPVHPRFARRPCPNCTDDGRMGQC